MNKFVLLTAITLFTTSIMASSLRVYEIGKGVTDKKQMEQMANDLPRAMHAFSQCKEHNYIFSSVSKLEELTYVSDRNMQGGYLYTVKMAGRLPMPSNKTFTREATVTAKVIPWPKGTPVPMDAGTRYDYTCAISDK